MIAVTVKSLVMEAIQVKESSVHGCESLSKSICPDAPEKMVPENSQIGIGPHLRGSSRTVLVDDNQSRSEELVLGVADIASGVSSKDGVQFLLHCSETCKQSSGADPLWFVVRE